MIRKGFELRTDKTGTPIPDKSGQAVYVAEAVTPGRLASRFGTDNDGPDALRLRVIGSHPGHGPGTVCRLAGRSTISAWYSPRARGSDASSDLTITAERVEAAPDAPFAATGGIAAELPPALLLGQRP